ncbi:MAG TPA: DUF748 domain-containing protein [Thermodesulfobacteriota bacterium]|nr:DUF748 domain-containing protein [Thermodesulfobacteriota bacterium]
MNNVAETTGRKRPFFRRPWPWVALSIITLLVAALIVPPLVLRHMVEGRLAVLGAEEVEIEDLGFNPFTGRATLQGLRAKRAGVETLLLPEASLQLSFARLFKKELHLKSLIVRGVSVSVERTGEGVLLVGGIRPAGGFLRGWGIEVERVELYSCEVRMKVKSFEGTIEADTFELSGLSNTDPGTAGSLRLDGRINGADLNVDARVAPFSPTPGISGRVRLSGFSLESLSPPSSLSSLSGTLAADTGFEVVRESGGWRWAAGEGVIDIKGLKAVSSSTEVSFDTLAWEGGMTFLRSAPLAPPAPPAHREVRFEADGALEGEGASLYLPARELLVKNSGFKWKGGGSYLRSEGTRSVGLKGEFRAEETGFERGGVTILGFNALSLGVEGENAGELLDIGSISIEGFFAGRPSPTARQRPEEALLSSKRVEARNTSIAGLKRFSIGSVDFVDLFASLEVDPKGRLILPWRQSSGKKAPGGSGGKVPDIGIAELKVSGKSRVEFKDGSVKPAYRASLDIGELIVRNIDTTGLSPESPFTFKGNIDKYTKVTFEGTLNARALRLTMESKGRVEALDLPPLSPYSVRHTGYSIKSGHMDAAITMKITEGKMDGQGDLLVKNLDINPADSEKIQKIKTELTMPLDAVVSLLKDRDDDIRVKIPVTGDIKEPGFEFGHIINQALMKASKKTAFSFLKYYFQPYGTFIIVGEVVGKVAGEAIRVRLDPVFFAPGAYKPDVSAIEYLDRVAGLMTERPGIVVKLCGHSNLTEASLMGETAGKKPGAAPSPDRTEELSALARERASFIKDHLVEEYGVSPERLFICEAEVDEDPQEAPRVELLI